MPVVEATALVTADEAVTMVGLVVATANLAVAKATQIRKTNTAILQTGRGARGGGILPTGKQRGHPPSLLEE